MDHRITDLIGGLGLAITHDGTPTYQYTNLHGDITCTATDTDTSPTIGPDYDEYGNPSDQQQRRYGWLGGKQRSSDTLAGLTLMGARLYSPILGRFLQVDPVPGGSANNYDYCNADSVNCFDLDGEAAAIALAAEIGLGLSAWQVIGLVGFSIVAYWALWSLWHWHGWKKAIKKLRKKVQKILRAHRGRSGEKGHIPSRAKGKTWEQLKEEQKHEEYSPGRVETDRKGAG